MPTYSGQKVEIKCFSKLVVNFSQDTQHQSQMMLILQRVL